MKKSIILFFVLLGFVSIFAFTPQSDIEMRNFYAMYNVTNITAYEDVCIIGGNCLSNVTTAGIDVNKTYVDEQNVIYNNSMKTYADSLTGADVNKTYVDFQDVVYNDSIKTYVDAQDIVYNDSIKNYVDSQDVVYNDSIKTYIDSVSGSDVNKTYVDDTFITLISEGNLNVNSSSYWDALNSPSDITGLTSTNIDSLDWTKLQTYPSACPANSYVTQIADTITCTAISDVYISNSGDIASGNYNFTGKIQSIESVAFKNDIINHNISDNSTCIIIKGDTSTLNIC